MPDFDKDLKPVLKNQQESLPRLDNPASTGRFAYEQSLAGQPNILDKFFGKGPVESPIAPTVTSEELYENRRYGIFSPDIVDIEDQKAYAQTFGEKAANGILKGLNLTATTFAGGFGMLYGLGSSAFTGRLADIWDNPSLRALDNWNNEVDQVYLPNYYTNIEKDAKWYSSDNWFKANFLFDKLIKNSGYAVGAMVSGNVANAGIKLLGKGIGAAATALESANSFKLFTPLLRNTARAFSVGKNLEAAAVLEKEISSIADLTAKSSRLGEIAAETSQFAKINALGRRTAIAAYSSAGEASFEALQTAKEYKENLINEYTRLNGYEPSGEDLKDIERQAESVGKASFFGNLAILGATEYVQLPRLLGSSYAADKQAANSLLGQVDDVVLKDGKYVRVEPTTKFGKLYDKVTGVGKYVADPKEGLQEGLQYALQVGVQNYYNKAYQTDAANVWSDGFLYGLVGEKGALMTKEGAESILLGTITGGLMQARGNYQEGRALTDNTNRFLDTLNGAPTFKEAYVDRLNSVNRAVILQQQQQQAVAQGDKLEVKDLDADLMHNYLVGRIKYGRIDMVLDEIKDLKREGITEGGLSQLKEEGLANINDTVESFQQRLTTLEQVANSTSDIYKALDLRYSGLVDRQGNRTYPPMVIDKMAYAAAKIADYDVRIPKMNSSLLNAGILTGDVLEGIIKENKPNKEATKIALDQINGLDVTSETKDELKTALSDVIELSMRRKLFMEEYDDIKENPSSYLGTPEFGFGDAEELPVSVDQEVVEKKKKKIVAKELEVGKEYSIEQPVYRQGNELVIAPKLTVVSQTLGGELEVRLPNGSISFFTPEQFKQFKITDQASTGEEIEYLMDNAIDNVFKKAEFKEITKPESDKLAYVNSLQNPELTDAVFNEFEKLSKDYFKKRANVKKAEKSNKDLKKTLDEGGSQQVPGYGKFAESRRKPKNVLPRATVATKKLPGYENSQVFGANLYNFPNRKNIRGVYITQKNEAALGLGGLMNHIKGTSDVDPSKTIAFVMVEQVGNKLTPVDKDGKPLSVPSFDTAIYQVMPDPSFKWSEEFGGEDMFPEGTPDNVKTAIKNEYTTWVNETLETTELIPHTMEASFGMPQKVKDTEGKDVEGVRTSVTDAGLINKNKLATDPVIYVPTIGDGTIQRGSTIFTNAIGKIFLIAPNGYVPLENKLHSEKEAKLIYDVLYKLAGIKYTDGTVTTPEAERLINWLRSTVYWGSPKNAPGINSVWFEDKGVFDGRLNLSNKGLSVPFNPIGLEANKDNIIAQLQQMYNNVRSAYVAKDLSNWNKPYEQITSIDSKGNIKSKIWPNYQTYLLSSEGREGSEIPLTVPYKPLKGIGDINRDGIYFVATDTADRFAGVSEKATAKSAIIVPKTAPTTTYNLEGQPNVIDSPQFGRVTFIANGKELRESNGKRGISLIENDENKEAIKKIADARKIDNAKAASLLAASIYNKVVPQVEATSAPVEERKAAQTVATTPSEEDLIRQQMNKMEDDTPFRVKINEQVSKFEKEDWPKIEAFFKANFPMIPLYRVKNIIRGTNGLEAWGMLKRGGIYIYENAEVGTAYHEVFEAVWKMFSSPEERQNIINEFKGRSGSFVDRMTGQEVKYSEATPFQIKEQLAEEFRDFVKDGKVPVKPAKGTPFIVKLFNDLVNFIKSFFYGPQAARNTEELFNRMTTGFYREYSPYNPKLAYAKAGVIDITDAFGDSESEFRVKDMPGQIVHDTMQEMTYQLMKDAIKDNKSLFDITLNIDYTGLKEKIQMTALKSRKAAEELIEIAKDKSEEEAKATAEKYAPTIEKSTALWKTITDNWDELIVKHKEYLAIYNIQFDENDEAAFVEEKGKEDPYGQAHQIDNFKKANASIKLLLSTLPTMRDGKLVYSSINGVTLVPASQAYMAIINRTHNSRTPDEMIENLRKLAEDDENYRSLYYRITRSDYTNEDINFDNLNNNYDVRLVNLMWRLFKKQNPIVKNLFILENGEVQVGESNFTTATRQLASDFSNAIVETVKNSKTYFEYSGLRQGYAPVVDRNGKALISREPVNTVPEQIKFLNKLGIEFDEKEVNKLSIDDSDKFSNAVKGIKKSFVDLKVVATLTGRTLSITGRLLDLAEIQAKIENPEFDSVFYNVNGDPTQTFLGVNALSNLYDYLSKAKNINELADTPYAYLLTDVFAQNSVMLNKMFNIAGDGARISGSEELMSSSWADGTIDSTKGKKKQSSRLTYQERLIQEINMNLEGFYYNLVPGDASLEHMVYMGNTITKESLSAGYEQEGGVYDIFKGYFISELGLARDERSVRNNKEMRFFKDILGDSLHDDVISEEGAPGAIYEAYKEEINKAVKNYIQSKKNTFKRVLTAYEIISKSEEADNMWDINKLAIGNQETISTEALDRELEMLQINFMINNIELHKILYSDPYQYKEELKRIKSFLSPRQAIVSNSSSLNAAMDRAYNEGFDKEDIGYTDFTQDYFRTTTLEDIIAIGDLPGYEKGWEETDGSGIISFKANRNFRIRAGEWNDAEERQYKFDINFEKLVKSGATKEQIAKFLKGNPGVTSAYTPIKPIVAGNKLTDRGYNDIVLDKFALYPLSFRVVYELNPDSNAVKLYDKMQKENIDYAVFKSGRKVGAEKLDSPYGEGDSITDAPFEGIVNVPFSIMSIQSEVPSKEEEEYITRGSQITKLVTLDFMASGVPVDFEKDNADFNKRFENWNKLSQEQKKKNSKLYTEIQKNQDLLEEMINVGYENLLKEMGIVENTDGTFSIPPDNISKSANTLRREILKREVNDNIADALAGFLEGEVVLEATPAYQQVRNILYSIADRNVISQKIRGAQKVQIPSTFFEENRIKKEGKGYTSDVLKFYTNKEGLRVAEVMLPRWFEGVDMSDDELIDYLNNTPEGQEVLKGIGFRIPTQKQNSIDAIVVKKFLPKGFGDSVVIPSALVKKAGSDFDIDKLFIYLKHIYQNKAGEIRPIPYFGIGEEARKKFADMKIDVSPEYMYRASLENEYIKSLENLVSSEENFEPLTTPNSADQLKDLADKVNRKLGFQPIDYNNPGNMLDRYFMSRLRQAFVNGKYAIGIAAVNQTNHSLNQRGAIYVDFDGRKDLLSEQDKQWLGDGKIKFDKYNTIKIDGKELPSLSMVYNAERSKKFPNGQRISDILSQFIDGYVDISKGPWIIELGATPNTASTWMFLAKIGVPIDTISYFMNQPIIRDYLRKIENSGYSWLFIEDFVKELKSSEKYAVAENYKFDKITKIPNTTTLFKTVGVSKMDQDQRAQQQFMLDEFLKYAKMAQQMFTVTQGSNFDTATFNDPYLVFKKQEQLIKAQNTIISSVDDILNNSFLNILAKRIQDIRNAYATILKSDTKEIREVMENVLRPYTDMSDGDFVKTAQKAVADLFDWAVQTDEGKKLNEQITKILLSKKNAAREIAQFVKKAKKDSKLKDNQVINLLENLPSPTEGGVNNMKIKNKINKVYDQNQIIYGFKQLKEYLGDDPLYNKIVTLAVLQSGLSKSPISFTSLLPYEDFVDMYNGTLSTLEKMSNLKDFYELGVFQRNNWTDNDIVPYRKAQWKTDGYGMYYYNNATVFGMSDELSVAIETGKIPKLLQISSLARGADKDYMVYSWEEGTSKEKKEMRKNGDYSYIKKGLFKKVYDGTSPLTMVGKYSDKFIYKMINAWGDGFKANEFYKESRKSVISNGFLPVLEVEDADIRAYFEKGPAVSKEESVVADTAPENKVESKLATPSGKIELKDGKEYLISDINAELLKSIGYKPREIGKLLKSIC
jgi:hypothetical protein